ncbi:MAG: DNA repair protein RecO [Bacteroidetes bacterium QS_8_68_15]|nr:MAG: DNA repair protein RecO [Bacteroidetes bacterium QS_8_68_15]
MIIRTEAVVLRSIDYGETSQIVTLFTRKKGRLAVMAKGARRTKSSFGSTLQPMAYTQVVFYYRDTRGLQTLSESAHLKPFLDLRRLTEEEDAQPSLFDLLAASLRALDAASERPANVLPYFQLRLAGVLGFAPAFEKTDVQALTGEGGVLSLESGQLFPEGQAPETTRKRVSRAALRAFAVFARASLDDVMRMRLPAAVRREVQSLADDYLRYHVGPDAFPDRSAEVAAHLFR